MKKIKYILTIVILGTLSPFTFTQNIGDLNGIYYQAVAIDEEGKELVGMDIERKPLSEKTIGVRFTITKGLEGTILWEETHTTTTDKNGLFTLIIGMGELTGNGAYTRMLDIPWIDADQFLKVEISSENDGNYRLVSNQRFMSVPYSFYTDDIADDAITTHKILDETIQSQDIDEDAVTTSEILDETIQSQDIDESAVTTSEILNGTILNEDIADSTVDLSTKVTNILPVINGGTGTDTLKAGSLLLGNGTDPVQSLGQADDGQLPIGSSGDNPVLSNLTAGTGIIITNGPGSIEISSGVQGVNSTSAGSINIGNASSLCPGQRLLAAGATWISPAIPLPGVDFGNVIVGSLNADLQGCMLTTYVASQNNIKVAIFNGTGSNVCFDANLELFVLLVQ